MLRSVLFAENMNNGMELSESFGYAVDPDATKETGLSRSGDNDFENGNLHESSFGQQFSSQAHLLNLVSPAERNINSYSETKEKRHDELVDDRSNPRKAANSAVGSFNSAFTADADDSGRDAEIYLNSTTEQFPDDCILLNIGGIQHKTTTKTLTRFPQSLLGSSTRRQEYYDPSSNEYFFDRNHLAFDSVLECYRSGRIIKPSNIPIHIFVRELLFYDIGDTVVENFLKNEELFDEPEIYPANPVQKYIYELLTHPDSCILGRIIALVDITFVLVAITSLCLVTLPSLQNHETLNENGNLTIVAGFYFQNTFSNPFFIVEIVCNSWFIADLILRFLVSPEKLNFFLTFLNVVDFVSIVPFVGDIIITAASNGEKDGSSFAFLLAFRILRLFRVFRIFKMDAYSDGLTVLTKTVKAARRELGIMALLLTTGMIFFGAAIYFAERGSPNTDYISIPDSFWWAVITWTTIGYGDVFPKTGSGKVVGCVCAVTGVLALGLIIPPVVRRFEHYFYRAQNMLDLELVYEEHRLEEQLRKEHDGSHDMFKNIYAMV